MAHLIYIANTSLDGYTEDEEGKFDRTDPSDEVFKFMTNLVQATRSYRETITRGRPRAVERQSGKSISEENRR